MKKFTLCLKKWMFLGCAIGLVIFCGFNKPEEPNVFIQSLLVQHHNAGAAQGLLKRFEISVTTTGFCRYRKVFANGKQEYLAFNLSRFNGLDYYGNTDKGDLYLRTKNDDVIVQTRNDRNGDIDSMGTYMVVPLKNIDPEQLNALSENIKKLRF